jgi:class 3 adenylate cyclase/DNA-binding CsgD family transcriptional regulator
MTTSPTRSSIVTLLFTDLVGSTELLTRLGDEAYERVRRAHFRLLRDAVVTHGGHEVKNLGDGLMVTFPSALEALACAVAMQRAAARHNRALPDEPLGVRIGLHVGEPIVDEDDYFGTAVVVAKRLCDQAVGGQIIASALVRELAGTRGDHALRDLGGLTLKGIGAPVAAVEVAWAVEEPPPAAAARHAPLVGRGAELAALRERLAAAQAGAGGVALVAGEPGIGKTRLILELAERARATGWRVLSGGAYDAAGMPPYLPLIEALQGYVRGCPPEELVAQLGSGAQELALLLPEVRRRLPHLPERAPIAAQDERYRLFESVADYLLAIARAAGVAGLLLCLDDLHWADEATLLLLEHLGRRIGDAPVLIVASYRDTELDAAGPLARTVQRLTRQGPAASLRVDLSRFPETATADLLAALAERALPGHVVRTIHDETDGNPFFVQEVYRYLDAAGRLVDAQGDWRPDLLVGEVDVPPSVRLLLGQRLAQVSGPCRRVLTLAAVIGRTFRYDVLDAVAGMDEDELLEAIDEAERSHLVESLADDRAGRVRFAHELIRQTLLSGLSLPHRQRLHRRAAAAIERVHARDLTPHLAAVAAHYRLGGAAADADKALAYGRRAATAARAVFAWEAAARELEAALALVGAHEAETRCDLLLELAEVCVLGGEPLRGADVVAEEAYVLADRLGDATRASRACVLAREGLYTYGGSPMAATPAFRRWAERADRWAAPGTRERVRADIALGDALWQTGRYAEAWALRQRTLALARELGDTAGLMDAAAQSLGRGGAPEWDEAFLRLAEETTRRVPADEGADYMSGAALYYCGWTFLAHGDRARAERLWRTLAERAERWHQPRDVVFARRADLVVAVLDGDLAAALVAGERVVARAVEQGGELPAWVWSANHLYRPLLHLGRFDEALALVEPPPAGRLRGLDELSLPPAGVPRMLCLAHAGHHDEARALVREFVVARRWGEPETAAPTTGLLACLEASVLGDDREMAALLSARLAGVASLACPFFSFTCVARHLGAAAALLGDAGAARRHYDQAIAVANAIGFHPELALSRLGLAEVLLRSSPADRTKALGHLDAAITDLEAMGMQPALERALHLRHGTPVSTSGARAPAYPDALSAREVEVLRLLAAGRSNREIGEALVISLNTVERHVNHIFQKTGAQNRVEAARYADRRGLTG